MDSESFSNSLGYTFTQPDLLRRALTHRSFGASHNERLEFLGDSVLNCIIALELYDRFPDVPEGQLSRLRASLVSEPALARVAAARGIGGQLLLGEGELRSGGSKRPSILADALEAIIGATFIDGGFEPAQRIVRDLLGQDLSALDPSTTGKDAKTLLQECLQGQHLALPKYQVIATQGEAHAQKFRVECLIPALDIRTVGEGSSRRRAEQDAAMAAYELARTR